jgi:hypothetical protein
MSSSKKLSLFCFALLAAACFAALLARPASSHAQNPDSTAVATGAATQNGPLLDEAKQVAMKAGWGKNVTVEFDDKGNMIVRSLGVPDHEILPVYQAVSVVDNKTTYPIKLQDQHMKVVIPLQPKLADKQTSTDIGLIGIAISGALFYSPYEADRKTLALSQKDMVVNGIPFLDACNGHPNPLAVQYHYHGVPYCITDVIDKSGEHSHLLGYLLDGFPVYGPQGDNGVKLTPKDLDECNGMFGPTPEYPEGIYHYVLTDEPPYIMSCYAGVIELDTSTLALFTRGVDTSFPPPPLPPGALLPPILPQPEATSSK